MKDVMIDFETFGNGKRACIVQVGAVYFDRQSGMLGEEFSANIDARDSQKLGLELDADTVYWWMGQSPEAIASIKREPLKPLRETMIQLNEFLLNAKFIWSHATFDFVILSETLKLLNIYPKFRYQAARDIRTLMDLAGVNPKSFKREGVHHNGLDDAKHQAHYCIEALRRIKL